jgi:hypothetical protein
MLVGFLPDRPALARMILIDGSDKVPVDIIIIIMWAYCPPTQ